MPEPPETFLLYFEYGRAELTAESIPAPAMILETINRRNSRDVRINGHSDTVGTREDNARLSFERAKEARELLVKKASTLPSSRSFPTARATFSSPQRTKRPSPGTAAWRYWCADPGVA